MTRPGAIYLDTNIFIMLYETSGETADLLRRYLGRIRDFPAVRLVTSGLTLSELLVKPLRDGDRDAAEAYRRLFDDSPWLFVAPVDRHVLDYAAFLRASHAHLKLPDAIHVSTAIGSRCEGLLTDDRRIKGNYAVASSSEPLSILRPDHPTIASLMENLRP